MAKPMKKEYTGKNEEIYPKKKRSMKQEMSEGKSYGKPKLASKSSYFESKMTDVKKKMGAVKDKMSSMKKTMTKKKM